MINKGIYKIVLIIQIIVLMALYYYSGYNTYNRAYLGAIVSLAFTNLLFFIVKGRHHANKKSYILSTVFLIGYSIVFFQKYIDLLVGLAGSGDSLFAHPNTINKCAIISTVGLLGFILGYISTKMRIIKIEHKNSQKAIKTKPLKLILVISTFLFVLYNYQYALQQSYSQELIEAQAGTMTLYSNIFFQISFFLYLSYIVNNSRLSNLRSFLDYVKNVGLTANICIFIYVFLILMTGDRGPVIVIVIAYWGTYQLSTKSDLRIIRTMVLGAICIIVVAILGESRRLDKNISFVERIFVSTQTGFNNSFSISPFTNELAGSVGTLHYSVEAVPNRYPYMYGSFQIRGILSSIPFFNHIVYQFADPHFRYRSSAFYVTWLIQGEHYNSGSGSSCNADLYLSFGLLGVLFGLYIWGLIYRKLEDMMDMNSLSHVGIITFLFFLSYSIYVCRAPILCFFNFLMFTLLLHLLYSKIIVSAK